MIAKFWAELFTLGDKYKEIYGGDSQEYKILGDVKSVLQKVYDESTENAKKVTAAVTEESEAPGRDIISALNGISFFKDRTDNTEFYEIDANHFDSITEVLQHVVEDRNNRYLQLYLCAKGELLNAIREERDREIERQTKKIAAEYNAKISAVSTALDAKSRKWLRKIEE